MKTSLLLIIGMSVLVTIGRFYVPGHDLSWPGTYEGLAHIWVGALLVWSFQKDKMRKLTSWACIITATAVETVMFMTRG